MLFSTTYASWVWASAKNVFILSVLGWCDCLFVCVCVSVCLGLG